jgi:hypothetical protein
MASGTIKRTDYSKPRMRLAHGEDPHDKLRRIYNGESNVRVTRSGEIIGRPTGFTDIETRNLQKPQDPIDQHGKSYDNDTGGAWEHASGDSRPAFDHNHNFRVSGGNTATGKDCTKSPFSRAGKDFR